MGKSAAVTVAEAVHLVPIVQLAIWPGNPRHTVDNFDLKDLVASIKSKGIQEPLKVRKRSDGQLEIYCGKRRYLAAKASGLASVPCIIRQIKDEDIMELAIIDNLQREDVDVIEEAQAIADLYAKRKSWKDVSSVLGKEPRELAAKAVLSRLSKEGQSLLHAGRMTLGTAKLIAPLD